MEKNTISIAAKAINTPARALKDAEYVPDGTQASVQVQALLRLREMILAGELPGGARIAELTVVEKLGFSRTPIRAALMRLEQEGLLDALPKTGSGKVLKRELRAPFWAGRDSKV